MPDQMPKVTEHVPADRRVHRAAGRARLRLPGRRRRLLPRRALPRVRAPVGQRPEQMVEEPSRTRCKEDAARLRALEGEQARRGHLVGLAVGPRPARLAHRVLGDGRAAARARRSRSTAAGSTSSSPTTRTSSRSRARSAIPSRRSGRTTGCSELTGEKMSKSVGNIATLREVLDELGARDAARLLPRRPLAQADRLLRRDDGAGRGAGRGAARRVPRSHPQPAPPRPGMRFARRARRRLQHARGARGAPRLARPRAALRARWRLFGLALARRVRARRRRRSAELASASPAARAPSATSSWPIACAAELEAAGWEMRDEPGGGYTLVRRR